MSARRNPDHAIAEWLRDEADAGAPDRLIAAVRTQLESTDQRRAWWPVRRFGAMNTASRLAAAMGAIAVVAVVAIFALPRLSGPGQAQPSTTPSASPNASSLAAAPSSSASAASPSPSRSPSPSPVLFANGPLPAGSYTIQPFVGPGGLCVGESLQAGCIEAGAEDDSIRITLTVPDGWTGLESGIVPDVESYSPPGGAGLLFGRGGWLYTVSKACGGSGPDPNGPTIPTGTTVDAFVAALVNHPDYDVTSPVDVTLAGYSAKYLEFRAPANTGSGGCGYFVWEPGIYAQGPNALWRIWVLDVDGVRVVVRSDSFPGTSPKVQAQLASIVESIKIEP